MRESEWAQLGSEISLRDRQLVDALCDEFERAMASGAAPTIEQYLSRLAESIRGFALSELLAIEFERQINRGLAIGIEDYRDRFPAHGQIVDIALERAGQPIRPGGPPPAGDSVSTDVSSNLSTHARLDPACRGAIPATYYEPPQIPGYVVSERIGKGGMGMVYAARDMRLDRLVAVKLLPPEYADHPERLERFRREARTASALNHPAICTIHDVGTQDGQPYMVMEFVDGRTFRELVRERLPIQQLAGLMAQVARALTAAHAAGIVHRDIKPENLMIRQDGYVKVLDFGLAKHFRVDQGPGDSLTGVHLEAAIGTPPYMSPEQTRGEKLSSASDIFSLATVIYELVTGQRPFVGHSTMEILHAVATAPVVSMKRLRVDVPYSLDALLQQMLQKNPQLRPSSAEVAVSLEELATSKPIAPAESAGRRTVGRLTEFGQLRAAFASAVEGAGNMACVCGEPGIGKTTLIHDFLQELSLAEAGCSIATGACSQRLVEAEAYLPILEALQSLVRDRHGGVASRIMEVVAPTWYLHVSDSAPRADHRGVASSTERLKRELLTFFQEFSRLHVTVLFIDDFHWADVSTVDLLAFLGPRCHELRLLTVVTYRPTEMTLGAHPFLPVQLELEAKGISQTIHLGCLNRSNVDELAAGQIPGNLPRGLASLIFTKTEGNPLFAVDLLRYLRDNDFLVRQAGGWEFARPLGEFRDALPTSVRSMIERKLSLLNRDDRRLLAAASVQGHEFDLAIVSELLGIDVVEAEEQLSGMDRVHALVRPLRQYVLPDGTPSVRYGFVHILYQNALYDDLPPLRKVTWSSQTAETLLRHYGEQHVAVAAELSLLFDVAGDAARSAEYFLLAARNASRLFAFREAASLAQRGLEQLQRLPIANQRPQCEMQLQLELGGALQPTRGYGTIATGNAFRRAFDLGERIGSTAERFSALSGLWFYHMVRVELPAARELAEKLLALSQRDQHTALVVHAHRAMQMTTGHQGEFHRSLDYFRAVEPWLELPLDSEELRVLGSEPGIPCLSYAGWSLWPLGFPDAALQHTERAVARARQVGHPLGLSTALYFASILYHVRGDIQKTHDATEESARIGEAEFNAWSAWGNVFRGWVQWAQGAHEKGISLMRQALEGLQAMETGTGRLRCLCMLAGALAHQQRIEEAQELLDEASVTLERTGEFAFRSDIYRTQGDVYMQCSDSQAEHWYRRAIDVACQQQAKSLELRAVIRLARLLRSQHRHDEARQTLSVSYGWFTEGHDTADLREAAGLLRELA